VARCGVAATSDVLPLRGVVDGGAWMDDIGMYVVVNARPPKSLLE